ncbi:MAG TPA: hypothetical protein VII70_07220 [Steroidobacteraceae bacterium]
MWQSRVVPLPCEVEPALCALFGAGVSKVRIIEYSFFARLHPGAVATTRRGTIYLRGAGADFFANPSLLLHEYCHVMTQWGTGRLTSLRYVLEWLKRGYWDNRFEIEAREFAQSNLYRFRALLSRQS